MMFGLDECEVMRLLKQAQEKNKHVIEFYDNKGDKFVFHTEEVDPIHVIPHGSFDCSKR